MIRKIVGLALMAAVSQGATAATYITAAGAPDPGPAWGEQLVVTFDVPNATGYVFSGGLLTATGALSGAYAAPALDGTIFGYVTSPAAQTVATLSTPDLISISFYWGSIDTHNRLEVLGAAGGVLLDLMGNAPGIVGAPTFGNQASDSTNRRIFITAGVGEVITGLRFTAGGVAYEFDDFAAIEANPGVPEPATWALLIAGFGMVGVAARRRRPTRTAL